SLAIAVTLLMVSGSLTSASATPIQLTTAEWATATAALPLVTETLESFPTGTYASPLTLVNGSYATVGSLPVVSILTLSCGDSDHCLLAQLPIGLRTFSAFPAGTTLWSSDLFTNSPVGAVQQYAITVVGLSGSLTLNPTLGTSFLAFSDASG